MDAHALKQLSRAELQKLAKSNNIKANGKSQIIIEELVKKYSEGVPKVVAPVPRVSSRLQKTGADVKTKKNAEETGEETGTLPVSKGEENTAKAKGQEDNNDAQRTDIAGLTSMSAPGANNEVKPIMPTVAAEDSTGDIQDTGSEGKMPGTHTTDREITTSVEDNSKVGSNTTLNGADVTPQGIASGPATPEATLRKGSPSSAAQETSSPNTSASGRGYRFGQPSASITGRRIAGGTRVSRYLATPRASLTQAGNRSSSSPQLATPDALAKLMPDESRGSHEKPLSGSSKVYSPGRRRNIPASDDLHDGAIDNSKTPQSCASTSSSFPVRETPSPAPEREGATEEHAKAMLCALMKKVGELTYWRNELANAQYVIKQANERNKAIQEKIIEVQRNRKVAERFYMAALKKDERLHNGAKTWKPQEPGQPERDYSYVAEESEEQDTSDFVADSDESRRSADNADDAVGGGVKAADEPQHA